MVSFDHIKIAIRSYKYWCFKRCDYYPFGMTMPKRSGSAGSYRYGFQGQEKDDEIKGIEGSSLNYKYRMHDPRVGRFFAADPLTAKYPHYTPYSFSGNKVIAFGELEGLEEIIMTEQFKSKTKVVFEVINQSDILRGYFDAISLESKKDKQIIYFTTYIGKKAKGRRGPNGGFTMRLDKVIEQTNRLRKEKGYSKKLNRIYDINMSLFEENGLNFNDLSAQVDEGKELFLVAINLDKIKLNIDEQVNTIIHEINAPDHLKDQVNGVKPSNGYDGHIKYFDLTNYPSGLTEEQIKADYSPHTENVNPNSPAGKDISEIRKALKKWVEEFKKEFDEKETTPTIEEKPKN